MVGLFITRSCSNLPKKLKPGNYWYDKASGLWRKEGNKPSQIISPHLNVGGPMKADVSNGNTQVYINGREITKVELRMLKLAGVQCAGNPHFWVNEDGSYQEEGQKNTKDYTWGKAGTKLLCAVLSLAAPSKSSSPCGEQAKILYKDMAFSEDERDHIKLLLIQTNVYCYIGILLEGREHFEEENLNKLRKNSSTDDTELTGTLEVIFPAATRECAPLVEELCNNLAYRATYNRRSELKNLPITASYFLERVMKVR